MRAQLEHLVELAELPNVTLQVLRFDVAVRRAGGPCTVLRFAEPDLPDIVYIEQLTSAVYLDKPADVEHYRAAMDRIAVAAACPRESAALITTLGPALERCPAGPRGRRRAATSPGPSILRSVVPRPLHAWYHHPAHGPPSRDGRSPRKEEPRMAPSLLALVGKRYHR